MTPERGRLWSIYDAHQAANNSPGQFIVGGFGNLGISTAGTPLAITLAAIRQIRIAQEIEPKLDDPDFVRTLLGEHTVPAELNLKWCYNHLDFGLSNEPSNEFFILMRGLN